MSQIKVEFDNTLKFSDIIVTLLSSSPLEAGESYKPGTDKAQTKIIGIQVPLISINSTVIDFNSIVKFRLESTSSIPTLHMIVEDKWKLIENVDKPRNDNEVRIQILPRFDNVYKKINMTFHISSIHVEGGFVILDGTYKLPEFTNSKTAALGELDSYSLFKQAAMETGLGFATNISQGTDSRYVYCQNKSWAEVLNDEIVLSGNGNQMLDWWVDFWNNINLVDIYDRYTTIDNDDDMKIWISGQIKEMDIDTDIEPQEVVAVIHTHPGQRNSELWVENYVVNNNPVSTAGTDRVYSVFEDDINEYKDYLIQDGDIKRDVFTRYEYLGEVYGGYNYFIQKEIRSGLLQKINSETIKVTLQTPLLGIMRGHKVNFIRYVNDDLLEFNIQRMEEAGAINRNVKSNIPLEQYELEPSPDGAYRIDKTVSGQYLVIGVEIIYNNGWRYVLTLARPACDTPDIINQDNNGNG